MRTRSKCLILAGATVAVAIGAWAWSRGEPRGSDEAERARATYPPLDTPKAIADGIWIVDSGPMNAMGLKLPVRMTILRLENGDLLLHSPTRFSAGLARSVDAVGRVRHLVAPNVAHWTFLADWQRAYPDATSWAAPGLRERAQVQASDVRFDAELGNSAPTAWADTIQQGVVAGGGFHEV